MAQHTRAQGSDGDAVTARTTTPAGPAAPGVPSAPPDHGNTAGAGDYAPPRRRDRVPVIAGIIVGVVIIGLFITMWGINRPQPAPTPPPAPAPAASSTTATTPPVAPSTAAYAAAEKTYRAWQTNVTAAFLNYQPDKLDASLVTPDALAKVQTEITRLGKAANNTTARASQDIKSITGADYSPSSLTLRVCAVTDFRFIDATGKDVTVHADGSPAAPNTTPRTNDVRMVSPDSNKTWQVASVSTEVNAEAGQPC